MQNKGVYNWLLLGCLMIAIMVIIGGITRLTHSGLSITEWNVITGTIPPLTDSMWQEEFQKYQQYPQFKLLNYDMTLSEYKTIYFWEFIHRLWGRLMGFAFFIPFLYFYRKKIVKGWLLRRCLIIMLGGALVGGLGWFMVASGLKDKPDVSHFRLAIHLSAAFGLFCYILWTAFDLRFEIRKNTNPSFDSLKKLGIALFVVVFIQIIYGAFTAGLDAGTIYNTWPLMNGQFMPANVNAFDSFWTNFFAHKDGVQFVHRNFAFVVVTMVIFIWFRMQRVKASVTQNQSVNILLIAVIIQFLLGVATILLAKGGVPVWIGVIHQIGALGLLSAVMFFNHRIRRAFVA